MPAGPRSHGENRGAISPGMRYLGHLCPIGWSGGHDQYHPCLVTYVAFATL